MELNSFYQINDVRGPKQLENESFSKYYKKDVFSQFKKNLMDKRLEEAVNWCIELMLSLEHYKIYEILINIACKYVNINNPKLPLKLFNKYKLFLNKNLSEEECRNSQVIRNHIIELCVIICLSNKSKSLGFYKIKENEFDLTNIINRLNSKEDHISNLMKKDDPQEIKVILNELCDNLKNRNYEKSLFWVSFIIEYEKNLKKNKSDLLCHSRHIIGIDPKYHNDVIWFVWSIVLNEAKIVLENKKYIQIEHLFKLYTLNFKPSNKYKKCQYLFYALKYFTYNYNIDQELCIDNYLCIQITAYINILFKRKTDNEIFVIKDYTKKDNLKNDNKPKSKKKNEPISVKKQLTLKKKEAELKSQQKFDILNKLDNII